MYLALLFTWVTVPHCLCLYVFTIVTLQKLVHFWILKCNGFSQRLLIICSQLCELWTSLVSLGKLEEEFERKFNSLPQYSPMTFDKKGTAVMKKKKTDSSAIQEEVCKAGKGKNKFKDLTLFNKHNGCSLISSSHPWPTPPRRVMFSTLVVFRTSSLFVKTKPFGLHNIAFPCSFFLCFFAISGPSPSQKKTSFHKIVRKHKHKKEKPGAVDKGELECWYLCIIKQGCEHFQRYLQIPPTVTHYHIFYTTLWISSLLLNYPKDWDLKMYVLYTITSVLFSHVSTFYYQERDIFIKTIKS